MDIQLLNVRLSFAQLFTPKAVNDGEPRFNANFLMDPTTKEGKENIKKLRAGIDALVKSELKGAKLGPDRICLRKEGPWDGYEDMYYCSAASKTRPNVVDRDKTPLAAEDGKPYSGCYVDAVVRLWAQNNKFGKRINASLEVVRFRKDGEAFGATKVSADVLPDLDDDEDDWDNESEDDDDDLG